MKLVKAEREGAASVSSEVRKQNVRRWRQWFGKWQIDGADVTVTSQPPEKLGT